MSDPIKEIEDLNNQIANCVDDNMAIELQAKVLKILESFLKDGGLVQEVLKNKKLKS